MWTCAPICRSLEHSTSWCQQVWIERFRSVQCFNHGTRNTRLLINNVPRRMVAVRRGRAQANETRESVWRHRNVHSLHPWRLMSPTVFVGAVVGCLRCLFHERVRCRLLGERGSKIRSSSAATGVHMANSAGSQDSRGLGQRLSSLCNSTSSSTWDKHRCEFHRFINNPRLVRAGEATRTANTKPPTISGGCTVGENIDPAAIDLAYVPYLSHVWEATILIYKHASLRHCA